MVLKDSFGVCVVHEPCPLQLLSMPLHRFRVEIFAVETAHNSPTRISKCTTFRRQFFTVPVHPRPTFGISCPCTRRHPEHGQTRLSRFDAHCQRLVSSSSLLRMIEGASKTGPELFQGRILIWTSSDMSQELAI